MRPFAPKNAVLFTSCASAHVSHGDGHERAQLVWVDHEIHNDQNWQADKQPFPHERTPAHVRYYDNDGAWNLSASQMFPRHLNLIEIRIPLPAAWRRTGSVRHRGSI